MLQREVLVSKLGPIDALAASAVVIGEVTTLAHEFRNNSVEYRALVTEALLTSAKSAEVFYNAKHIQLYFTHKTCRSRRRLLVAFQHRKVINRDKTGSKHFQMKTLLSCKDSQYNESSFGKDSIYRNRLHYRTSLSGTVHHRTTTYANISSYSVPGYQPRPGYKLP